MGKFSAESVKARLTNLAVSFVATSCVVLTVCLFLVEHSHARRVRLSSASSSSLEFHSLVNRLRNFEERVPQVAKYDVTSVFREGLPAQEAEVRNVEWPQFFSRQLSFQPLHPADATHPRGGAENVAAEGRMLSDEGAPTEPETRKRGETSHVYGGLPHGRLNNVIAQLNRDVAVPNISSLAETASTKSQASEPYDVQSSTDDSEEDSYSVSLASSSIDSGTDLPQLLDASSVTASAHGNSPLANDRPSVSQHDAFPNVPQPVNNLSDALKDSVKTEQMLNKFLYHLRDVATVQAQQIRSNAGDLSMQADHVQLATGLQQFCTHLKTRDLRPRTEKQSWLGRTFHRLGRAFGTVKRRLVVVRTKISKWLRSHKKNNEKKKAPKVYSALKRMASRAWAHTKMVGKRVIAQIMRMLPLFFFLLNTFVLGFSISSVVVAPNPFSIIAVVCAASNILSYAFSEGTRIRGVELTRSIASQSESHQIELFGFVWADLKAEQDVADLSQIPGGESEGSEKEAERSDSNVEAIKLSQDIDRDQSVPEEGLKASPASQTLEAVRRKMYENLKCNSEQKLRQKLKNDIKEAWRTQRWKRLNVIIFASLRLLLEYASLGVKSFLELFGSAWLWVLDHTLRKSVRQLRMFKLFGKVSVFGEKLFYFMQWWMMKARYYVEYADTIRDLVIFIVENTSKISLLLHGGLSLVGGTGGLIFLCVFLWKLSKPAWKLYLTDTALKTSSIHEKAAKEFMLCQKDYHNFLLGTRAIIGDENHRPAIELYLPQQQATELIFLMAYLERYKFPQATHRVGLLEGSNPMQQYVAYQRVTRLRDLMSRIPPESRGVLVSLFSELKRWDMARTADSLHSLIMNNLQHCAVLYGRRDLAMLINKAITRYQADDLNRFPGGWVRFKSSEQRSLSRTLSFLVSNDPIVLNSPPILQRRIQAFLTSSQRSQMNSYQLNWLANTVISCAYQIIDKELLFTLDGNNDYSLDRATIRINNFPFFGHSDSRALKQQLKTFFTFFPVSMRSRPRRRHIGRRIPSVNAHLTVPSGAINLLGRRRRSRSDSNLPALQMEKRTNCPVQEPAVEIDTTMRYIKLRFLTSTTSAAPPVAHQSPEEEGSLEAQSERAEADRLCAEMAARSVVHEQVSLSFKRDVRRTLFGLPDAVCAPMNFPGFVALSRLTDEFVNGGVTDEQLPEALSAGLDILVNEHSSLVLAFARMHQENEKLAKKANAEMHRRDNSGFNMDKKDSDHTSEATAPLLVHTSPSVSTKRKRARVTFSSTAETDVPPELIQDAGDGRNGKQGTFDSSHKKRRSTHGKGPVTDVETASAFGLKEVQQFSQHISSLPQLTRLTRIVREEAFKRVVLQYVEELLPFSLTSVGFNREAMHHFTVILGIIQTAFRYQPWRLVEYIRDRLLSVHLRGQMNDAADVEETTRETQSTESQATGDRIRAAAEASEKRQARAAILDIVLQLFSESLARKIHGTLGREGSGTKPSFHHRVPLAFSTWHSESFEKVYFFGKIGNFVQGQTFNQIKEIVTVEFQRCLEAVDVAIDRLERNKGRTSRGRRSRAPELLIQLFDSDSEGEFERKSEAIRSMQGRVQEELENFLVLRIGADEEEAAKSQRMIIRTDQTEGRPMIDEPVFDKNEVITFFKEGRKLVGDILQTNTDRMVRALRWGYWKEDHFGCLDLSLKGTNQLAVYLTEAFKLLLDAKTPKITKFWTRVRKRLGRIPRQEDVSASRLAEGLISRLRVLHQSGLDGTYGSIDLRYSYKTVNSEAWSSAELQSEQRPGPARTLSTAVFHSLPAGSTDDDEAAAAVTAPSRKPDDESPIVIS
ncbi:hypothetical protein TGGT1_300220 [Toxoplasma gondii GT1]|uniref:Transmembrane protein n=2 Tax=Toxoplasma gondii TaxID=5811 RepID=S7UGX0_TOXGG|nr:hypothetical protein TGGT1_300220 [Toxoplasma gondii GT1]RQX66786.1 putative transmembrane protein [Toxoplasma gondii CAST]